MTSPWIAAFVALWVIVLFLAVVIIGVLRRIGGVLDAAEAQLAANPEGIVAVGGLPVASQAPDFRVFEVNGAPHSRRELAASELIQRPTMLIFMEEGCVPCQALAGQLEAVDQVDGLPLLVVMQEAASRPAWMPSGVRVVYQTDHELSRAFQNIATPQAYAIDSDRVVLAKRVVRSVDDLRELVEAANDAKGGEIEADLR